MYVRVYITTTLLLFRVTIVAEPALSSCWKYTVLPGPTPCHLEDTKTVARTTILLG